MRRLVSLLTVLALTLSARASGLLTPDDESLPPLRITDHLVEIDVRDGIALTAVSQTFHNDTSRRLEATYIFPLPEQADLTDFQMTFNGKMVKGEVLEADEAARIYESIVRRQKDPGLIEFIGRRLLQMRVFPIEPESDTTIEVRYQQICRPVSGMLGYHYPLRTRKTGGQAYGTVRFNAHLQTNGALKNIWSPTHAVEIVRRGEHEARVAYEAKGGSLEDDFLLLYDTADSDLGLSVVAHKPDKDEPGHFVLMMTPKQLWPEQEYQPQDVVFVIDTSGSMAGDKLTQAKSALRFCIDSLDRRDQFTVVRFSTGFDLLFDEPKPATAEHRAQARGFIDAFRAAGGTNITDTLAEVMRMPRADTERPFVVVFLTDGKGNREAEEILAAVKTTGPNGRRVFPFGVGHDVNTILLDQLAANQHGKVTYVQPGENLELVLGDFFAVISKPVLTNLRLTLPEIGATERFPATLGDLYHGQQLIIAGQFAVDTAGPVRLTATRNGKQVEYAWPAVSFRNAEQATYVPAIWAGRKISFLIDQIRAHGQSPEMVQEVIALSMEYGIQTPYTSWFVNPEQAPVVARRRGMPAPASPAIRRSLQRNAPEDLGRPRGIGVGGGGRSGSASAPREAGADLEQYHGQLDASLAAKAVTEEAGEAATIIAQANARMKDMRSRDDDRLDSNLLPAQKIDGRWYNRIDGFLVDATIDETTELLIVKFGSDAYFELARRSPHLRSVLSANSSVVVKLTGGRAVMIAEQNGIEQFSAEQRKQIGLESD